MSGFARDVVRKLARRVVDNPTSATIADCGKLAKAVLMLLGERP